MSGLIIAMRTGRQSRRQSVSTLQTAGFQGAPLTKDKAKQSTLCFAYFFAKKKTLLRVPFIVSFVYSAVVSVDSGFENAFLRNDLPLLNTSLSPSTASELTMGALGASGAGSASG